MLLWLIGCAFHVPPPVGGGMVPMPLVAQVADRGRPYVLIDNRLWFVDTGATRTTCDDDYMATLGVAVKPTLARTRGEVGSVAVGRGVLHDVQIGGWTFRRLPCAVRDLATTSSIPENPDDPVAGVLGANLLRHFVLDLDFTGRVVRLHADTAALPDVLRDGGVRLGREHGTGPRLLAALLVDGAHVDAVVDTGADRTYLPLATGAEVVRYTAERQGTGPGGAKAVEVVVRGVTTASVGPEPLPLTGYVRRRGHPGLLGMDALAAERLVLAWHGRRLARIAGDPPPLQLVDAARASAP